MAVAGGRRASVVPVISQVVEDLAQSLAERDQRGEIKLSRDALLLIRAINTGGDYEGIANSLAERDQRGKIRLSKELLELVTGVLGGGEAAPEAKQPQQKSSVGGATEVIRGEKGLFKGRRRI